ncbi:MAG TPA: hypothetical protein PLU72_03845 [Candidatus Ozemobacteraceae bacterium]|nr:hypothetical protein [Candidatus Ozemobacteraceae bacterium]
MTSTRSKTETTRRRPLSVRHGLALGIFLLLMLAWGTTLPLLALGEKLPSDVPAPGYIDKIPAPGGDKAMFYLFNPPQPGVFGVCDKDNGILWQKTTGLRSLITYFWAEDGASIVFVTDCLQKEADLRFDPPGDPASATRSWFFVLDAASGKILAEGDLDIDVLNLPKTLPDAVGASHLLKVKLENGVLSAEIDHRGTIIKGSRPLSELSPKPGKP